MKMRSRWEGNTQPWNTAILLNYWHTLYRSLNSVNLESMFKGVQSCWLSHFENDLTPGGLKSRPIALEHALLEWPEWQTFSWKLQLWQLVALKPFDLQILYYLYGKIQTSSQWMSSMFYLVTVCNWSFIAVNRKNPSAVIDST